MIRAYCNRIPAVPDFTSIHKRVNKLDIKIDETMDDDSENGIILAIDIHLKLQTEENGCIT